MIIFGDGAERNLAAEPAPGEIMLMLMMRMERVLVFGDNDIWSKRGKKIGQKCEKFLQSSVQKGTQQHSQYQPGERMLTLMLMLMLLLEMRIVFVLFKVLVTILFGDGDSKNL